MGERWVGVGGGERWVGGWGWREMGRGWGWREMGRGWGWREMGRGWGWREMGRGWGWREMGRGCEVIGYTSVFGVFSSKSVGMNKLKLVNRSEKESTKSSGPINIKPKQLPSLMMDCFPHS